MSNTLADDVRGPDVRTPDARSDASPIGQVDADERGGAATTACPVCEGAAVTPLLEIRGVPVVCNALYPTRTEALSALMGDLNLHVCGSCGHLFNSAFDPASIDYTQTYENSLHFSPHFQNYAEGLARRLIETYDIRRKTVVDIGCGKGDFLSLICELGENHGHGFDKSYSHDDAVAPRGGKVEFVQDYYDERYGDLGVDLLSCRHVLEHIARPITFIQSIRRALGKSPGAVVYFEVPNAVYTLRDLGIWDLIYEHPSFFVASSLIHLMRANGFAPLHVAEVYDDQFLALDCTISDYSAGAHPVPPRGARYNADAIAFGERYRRKVGEWSATTEGVAASGQRAVVWGGGSKGITFLNILDPKCVQHVVDINPRKHGKFVPGTAQEIVPPAALSELKPDVIVLMNGVYENEIRRQVQDMGLSPRLMVA